MPRTIEFNEIEILEKAVQVFSYQGYNGTSAQNLVDGLQISRSSLYNTFGDKRSLFIRALQHYRQAIYKSMKEAADSADDVEAGLREIFNMVTRQAFDGGDMAKGCFLVNTGIELAPHDEEIAAIVRQHREDVEEYLCGMIQKGQDEGLFSTRQSAMAFARFICNNFTGLRVVSKSEVEPAVYKDIIEVTLAALK